VGNLETHIDFNGKTTIYHDDIQNFLKEEDFDNHPNFHYTYTATGQIETITDESLVFGSSSFMLVNLLIIWLAPIIWGYSHAVKLISYFQLSLISWLIFYLFFISLAYPKSSN
jgi:hypothetical protein